MNRNKTVIRPISILFVALTAFYIVSRNFLEKRGVDVDVLLWGNVILYVVTLFSMLMAMRGLHNENPHAFTRSVFASITMKLFLALIAAFVYIAFTRSAVNKPGLFINMGLYLVYTAIEVVTLTNTLKKKGNG